MAKSEKQGCLVVHLKTWIFSAIDTSLQVYLIAALIVVFCLEPTLANSDLPFYYPKWLVHPYTTNEITNLQLLYFLGIL